VLIQQLAGKRCKVERRANSNKPVYAADEGVRWSFNISHHGDWVALVGHPHDRRPEPQVGIDVMDATELPPPPAVNTSAAVRDLLESLRSQLSEGEWTQMMAIDGDGERLWRLYLLWTLKESYIKGTGEGLRVRLSTVTFEPRPPEAGSVGWDVWSVFREGIELGDWRVLSRQLDHDYIIAIALPTSEPRRPIVLTSSHASALIIK